MENSKLIKLLREWSKEEWKAFGKFLKSPYFNSNKKLVELYNYLSKYFPTFSSKSFTKENASSLLFAKSKKNDEKQLANLMSQMRKQCDMFFAQQQLKSKPRLEKRLLCEYLGEQNQYELFKKSTKSLLQEIENEKVQTTEDNFWMYKLNFDLFIHAGTLKLKKNVPDFQNSVQSLTNFYISENMKMIIEANSRAMFLSDDTKVPLEDAVVSFTRASSQVDFSVKLAFYDLFKQKTKSSFIKVKQLFFENLHVFEKEEQLNFFIYLMNFVGNLSQKGEQEYYGYSFELYKEGLKHRFLNEGENIHSSHFVNLVLTGILVDEIDWSKKFITEYKDSLVEKDKKIVVNYCLARIYVYEKKFDQAVDLLNELEEIPVAYAFRVRNLSLRCLYELYLIDSAYYDVLTSRIESFQKYIRRDKIWSEARKVGYINFCSFMLNLIDATTNYTAKNKKELEMRLDADIVISKKWFLEKLDLLASKK